MATERQYWVRNEQGRTWGPYDLEALERLRGIFSEKWMVALDGRAFKPASEFPELSELAAAPRRAPPPPIPAKPDAPPQDEFEVRKATRDAARAAALQARLAKGTSAAAEGARADPPAAEAAPAESSVAHESSVAQMVGTPNIGTPNIGTPTIATPPAGTQAVAPPSPPALDALALPEEGELEAFPPLRLYALAALSSASGWLQLSSPSGTMLQISFRRGSPEHLESDDPELSLLSFLRNRGTVTQGQALEATAHAEKSGVDLVTALFQLQLIPPADAHRLLKEQMLALLDRALLMWRGRFSFERDAPPPPGAFPLGQRWTLLAESIRRLDAKPLRARLGARLTAPVVRSGGLSLGRIEELALTAQEARLYAAIDGVRTGEELLRDSQDPSATLRLLYLLSELGHLSFAANLQPTRAAQAGPADASPGAPPTPPPPIGSVKAGTPASRAASSPPPDRPSVPASAIPSAPPVPTARPLPPPPGIARPLAPGAAERTAAPRPGSAPPVPAPAAQAPAPAARPPSPAVAARPASAPATAAARPPSSPPRPPGVAARPPAPSAAARAPSAPAMPSVAGGTFVSGPPDETPAAMESRLAAVLARIEPADHFTALGLERKATAADVKKAFFQLARELHPDTVQDGNSPLRDLKQRLFSRVNEAAQVLQDEKRRKEHEDELDGKGNVDVARIFAAEEAFQRGEIMIKARKMAEGLALIEEAISINADEGEFYAWRGWARFVLAKDRKAQHPSSVADCKKALAMIDKCLPAWLFLGNMAKAMGDLHEAERSFRKVIELDPKHVEAMRELRAMGKKA